MQLALPSTRLRVHRLGVFSVQAPISCTAMVGDNPYDCSIVGVFPDAPNSTMQVRRSGGRA